MLSAILLIAVILEDGNPTHDSVAPPPLTPNEFVAGAKENRWMERRSVEFLVAHVTTEEMKSLDGTSQVEYRLYPQSRVEAVDFGEAIGAGFYVAISQSAAEDLKRIGVHDVSKHFTGKRVELSGTLACTTLQYATGPAYLSFFMPVYSLDHFFSVSEETEMKSDVRSPAWERISSWPEYAPRNSPRPSATYGIETDGGPQDSHAEPNKR